MFPITVGIFAAITVLLCRAGLDFAVIAAGTALSGTILMLVVA